MSVTITANSGNGSIAKNDVFSYSYSEDVTGLDPSEIKGGTSQVNFSAIEVEEDTIGNDHPNSALLINNTMQITDSDRGAIDFQVKSVSTANGIVSVVGDTIMSRLNVIKTAPPVGGPVETPKTLYDAIVTYCDLVGITPVFDGTLEALAQLVPVNYMSWTGNVWEHLKMLCSVASASMVDTRHIEMYVATDGLHFRYALEDPQDYLPVTSNLNYAVDSFEAAQSVVLVSYNTSYGTNRVVYDQANYEPETLEGNKFLASVNDSMQVEAGETITKRFKIAASLETVNQPVCVAEITRTPPAPYAGTTGEYVVVGNDDLPIQPSEWNALGGKLTIALTENPNEIEVTITAPPSYTMPTAANPTTEVTNAPYKIGMELGVYPAFWITGTGVFFEKKNVTFLTGAPDSITSDEEAATIDNIFVTNLHELSIAGLAAAQKICGPHVTTTQTIHGPFAFGETIGAVQKMKSNSFRVESAAYSIGDVQLTNAAYATMQDFDERWLGKTFAQFDSFMSTGPQALKFNEFTVIPLTGA